MNTPDDFKLTISEHNHNRHEDFYFTDIIFEVSTKQFIPELEWWHHWFSPIQVENQLFKVPRCNFAEESEIFATMFNLKPTPGGQNIDQDGSSDDHSLRLERIQKTDFILLLRVMFQL